MNLHKMLLIAGSCFLIVLGMAFYRDITIYERTGTVDLRNRVVGARLQQDGRSPYNYRWFPGDPVRYYDQHNIGNSEPTNITASPFFHNLMYPLAAFRQRTASRIWFVLEYVFLLVTGIIAFRLATNNIQKIFILSAIGLYVYTHAWLHHIFIGQMYILIPMLAIIIYYCLTRPQNLTAAFIGGLTTIVLLLIRPNMGLFLLPFLFLINRYSRKYLAVFFIPVMLVPAIHFSFESNRIYWRDYVELIAKTAKRVETRHTATDIQNIKNDNKYRLPEYEGWNHKEVTERWRKTNLKLYFETGNVYIIYVFLFKHRMTLGMINFLSAFLIIALLALFLFMRKKPEILTLPNVALFGYCLYMAIDLNSPIIRHQYYGTQWLFPVLLAASVYTRTNKWFYVPLLAGMVLNIIHTEFILMEHTLGEYFILVSLLCLSLTRKIETPCKYEPA